MLSAAGKVRSDADFIFYNQPVSSDGSVKYLGDNRDGEGATPFSPSQTGSAVYSPP